MTLTGIGRAKEWAKRLWEPGDTLSQQMARSGFWAFALSITNRLFRLIRTIVLARVLAPSDFGLMGIALLAMVALETFSQTGFQAALIQKKDPTVDYLDTAWTVSVLRGFVLFAILYLAAPHIALFFDTPAAIPIIWVIGISTLLNGLTNIGVIYFQKELEFSKLFVYQLSGTVANLIVAITAALLLRSVWSLILGRLAGDVVCFVVSYAIHPYRPRARFEAKKAKELYGFGRWVLGSSIIVFATLYGDDTFIGKILGTTALGLYQVASRFSTVIMAEFAHAVEQVAFPVYSKLQDDIPKLREGFLKTVEVITFLLLPVASGVFLLAPDFVRIFLGDKWMPMVPAVQILTISGLILSIQTTGEWLFRAVGRPNMGFQIDLVRIMIMAITIYPLTIAFGITGTAEAVGLGVSATVPIWWYASSKTIKGSYVELLKKLSPSLAATSVMSLGVLAVRNSIGQEVGIVGLMIAALTGIAVYTSFALFHWRQFQCGPIESLQVLRRSL
jgi:lipopolysaccharide exporter